jgi:hypothetical protein
LRETYIDIRGNVSRRLRPLAGISGFVWDRMCDFKIEIHLVVVAIFVGSLESLQPLIHCVKDNALTIEQIYYLSTEALVKK